MPADSLTVVVDRIEGTVVVLEADDGRRFEVDRSSLASPREGLVYRVPLDAKQKPAWAKAVADPAETGRRLKELGARMRRLRDDDRGGDIEL